MNQSPSPSEPPPPARPEEISKWVRAYAQNRSLGLVVFLFVFLALSVAIGGLSYLAALALRWGNTPLLGACLAALLVAMGAVVYLSVPRWGGKLQERVVRRLYAKEGNVAFSVPGGGRRVWGAVLAVCFGVCILASVAIGFVVDIPSRYMQPISALYVAPFLVGVWVLLRPMSGYAALLWPLLYAIHAILIVAGAPIVFTGPWDGLNMLIPIAGYGALSGLAGHFYSRLALRHLKKLTQDGAVHSGPSVEAPRQ